MKGYIFLLLLTICLLSNSGNFQQTNAKSPYPEVLETDIQFQNIFYNFTEQNNSLSITRTFSMSEFRDVTIAKVILEEYGQLVANVTISVQINGINASNNHVESSLFDQETILFILDEHAMILPGNPNALTLHVKVHFRDPFAWEVFQHKQYMIRFDEIAIETVYRQNVTTQGSQLNQTNSQFTAIIFDPNYILASQGTLFANKSNIFSLYAYQLKFFILLPMNLESNYYLNLTFSFNSGFSIRSIHIDNFGLISSTTTDTGINYVFRYTLNNNSASTPSLATGLLEFNPKNSGLYQVAITGSFFITNNFKIFPGSPEMDLFLFINASLIIPLIFLSKLIYRRLFY